MTISSLPDVSEANFARSQGASQRQRDALTAAAAKGDRTEVRKAAEKFESQFLAQMLGHMFKGIKTDGMFGGGQAESTWRDFYVEEVSNVIAKRGGRASEESSNRPSTCSYIFFRRSWVMSENATSDASIVVVLTLVLLMLST